MLSDMIHQAYCTLKDEYVDYTSEDPSWDYPKALLDEVENIMQRLDALLFKMDCDVYVGVYQFEDDGSMAACKQALRLFKQEVYELAGDLTVDFEGREELFKYPDWSGNGHKWLLAKLKLKSEGKDIEEIKEKYLKPYWEKYGKKN